MFTRRKNNGWVLLSFLYVGITLASFKKSGTILEVNDKLKIYANGPLISAMISCIILGLMSSAPGDLLF